MVPEDVSRTTMAAKLYSSESKTRLNEDPPSDDVEYDGIGIRITGNAAAAAAAA